MPKYDAYELDQLLKKAGFTDILSRRYAWAIAMRESRGDSDIINKSNPNGSWDYGLFQINNQAHLVDVNWSKIFDAEYQCKLVYKWTSAGVDWSTWGLGNEKGWAKHLYNTNRVIWEQIQDDFFAQYDVYPQMVSDADPKTGVVRSLIIYGKTSGSVKKYQKALRRYCTKKQVAKLAPSGPTGYYGGETQALTKRALKRMSNKTGDPSWKMVSTTAPSKDFLMALGLDVI